MFWVFFPVFLINLYIYLDLCLVDFALETWRSVCMYGEVLSTAVTAGTLCMQVRTQR